MKMKSTLGLLAVAFVVMAGFAFALNDTETDVDAAQSVYDYDVNGDNEAEITDCLSNPVSNGLVNIPSKVDGYTVVKIQSNAFAGYENSIKKIQFPSQDIILMADSFGTLTLQMDGEAVNDGDVVNGLRFGLVEGVMKDVEKWTVTYAKGEATGSVPSSVTLYEGETFTVGSPDGLTNGSKGFYSWTDSDSNDYFEGETVTMGDSNLTLTSSWGTQAYSMTFSLDGGSGTAPTMVNRAPGNEFRMPDYSGTKAGYTFKCWSDGRAEYEVDELFIVTNKSMSFTAVWTENTNYTITFDSNGGTGSVSSVNVPEGGYYTIPDYSKTVTKDKYTLSGWKYGTTTYKVGEKFTMPGKNITMIAQWTAIPTHKVTYDLNGAIGTAPTQADVCEGYTFTVSSETGTYPGYKFTGWHDGTALYQKGATYTMGTKDVTLTAQWELDQNEVSFDLNGGTGTAPSFMVTTGTTFTIPDYDVSRDGYSFQGWTNSGAIYQAGDKLTMGSYDMVFVAEWKEKTLDGIAILFVVIIIIIAAFVAFFIFNRDLLSRIRI